MRVRRSWGRLPSALSVSPSAEREEKKRQKRHGDNCAKTRQTAPTSASGKAPKEIETILSLYPTSRRQPALSILPTTLCPPTPLGEARPPIGTPPHLTSVAIKRCALNLGRNHLCAFDAQHNQWSPFFLSGNSSGYGSGCLHFLDGFPVSG